MKKPISFIFCFSLLLFLFSCKSNSVISNEESISIDERMIDGEGNFTSHISLDFAQPQNRKAKSSESLKVDKACAVSISPVDSWFEQKRNEMGDVFDEVISDNNYYNSLAVESLKSNGIPTEKATREKQFIEFTKSNNSKYTIDLNKLQDAWGLILFNGTDNPVFWNATDIEPELKEIFKK